MADHASFTAAIRQEIARLPIQGATAARIEFAALCRTAGTVTFSGNQQRALAITTRSGAVARRAHALIEEAFATRPELLVRAAPSASGVTSYRVQLGACSDAVAADLGIIDERGRLAEGLPRALNQRSVANWMRGAMLGSGSVSSPGRTPHLEFVFTHRVIAESTAALLHAALGAHVGVVADEQRRRMRVTIKSGDVIGDVLVQIGATRAFLAWDDQRLRRQLRSDANRLANADAANVRRAIEASAHHIEAIERMVAAAGWEAFDDELREVALARLANPAASLTELGELLDPPLGKSAVRRRLDRIVSQPLP